jgi:centractin
LKNGVFTNDQDILTVFNHIYSKLEIKSEQIKERPIFITEPILNSFSHRRQIASILFDTLSVPALFFGSQPLLSLYASGNQSGVILETGDGISQCCVVYEGFSLPHSEVRCDFGGANITDFLQTKLRKNGYNFSTTAEYEIVKKIKENMCLTSLNGCFNYGKLAELGANSYLLPDGNSVLLGKERMEAPEILFRPGEAGLEFMCKLSFICFFCFYFFD